MKRAAEYRGYWWLPSRPEGRVHGILNVSTRERMVLDLDGTLIDSKPFEHVDFRPDIVLGQSMDGTVITLLRCIQLDITIGLMSGLRSQKLLVQTVLVGFHFKALEDVKFKSVAVEFADISDWTRSSGFAFKQDGRTTIISYTTLPSITASIANTKFAIEFSEGFHSKRSDVGFAPKTYFQIETESLSTLESLANLILRLQQLLALAIDDTVFPRSVTGFTPDSVIEIKGERISTPIEIYYRYGGNANELSRADSLLKFNDIVGNFEPILKNWLEKAQLLEPVFFGYFGSMYHHTMYLEQKFLAYVQAVESYHRRRIDGLGIPQQAYEAIYPKIMEQIPSEQKDWFDGKLRYNEPSLRRRLKELLSKLPWIDVGNGAFVNDTVVTRNYLIHFDEKSKDAAKSGKELLLLTLKLELLLKSILLQELGFTPEDVESRIKGSRTYEILRHETGSS
jgi:hypothetical protein